MGSELTPTPAEDLRRRRQGKVGRSWYVDEIHPGAGRRKYLYRALDRDGALVDVMLSEHRNLAAVRRFFRSTKAVTASSWTLRQFGGNGLPIGCSDW